MSRPVALATIALLAVVAPGARAQTAPDWVVDGLPIRPVYYDVDHIVHTQFMELRVLETRTGKTLWDKRFERQPDQVNATTGFIAVRFKGEVSLLDIKTGKDLPKIELAATAMLAIGGNLYLTHKNEVVKYSPPSFKPKGLGFNMPYIPFETPKHGIHLGDRVIWPVTKDTILSYDLDKGAIEWKLGIGAFRYTKMGPDPSNPDKVIALGNEFIHDKLHAFFELDGEMAIHGSRKQTEPDAKEQLPDADFIWLLSSKKATAGTRIDFQRVQGDAKGAPRIYLTWASPRPMLVARFGQEGDREKYRFDLFWNGAGPRHRIRIVDYNHLVAGAKGQYVLYDTEKPTAFEVVKADGAAKTLWNGRGKLLPRTDENAPYHALVGEGTKDDPMRIVALDPESGSETGKLELPVGIWDTKRVGTHLLLVSQNQPTVMQLDLASMRIARTVTLPAPANSIVLLPSGVTAIGECGKKLCLFSLEGTDNSKDGPRKDPPKPPGK